MLELEPVGNTIFVCFKKRTDLEVQAIAVALYNEAGLSSDSDSDLETCCFFHDQHGSQQK